jgi:hypothetical protein
VAQNTAPIGEKPISMNTTIEISEKKWKPCVSRAPRRRALARFDHLHAVLARVDLHHQKSER